jgi:ATP-binding cassette subfamily B protein
VQVRHRGWAAARAALKLSWRVAPVVFVGLVAITLVGGLLPAWGTWLNGQLFDQLASPETTNSSTIVVLIVVIGAVSLLQRLTVPISASASRQIEREAGLRMESQLVDSLNRVPYLTPFEDPAVHDRMQMVQASSINPAPVRLVQVLLSLVQQLLATIGVIGVLAATSMPAALLVVSSSVPATIGELRLSGGRVALMRLVASTHRRRVFFSQLATEPRAAKELRLFGLGTYFLGRMQREYHQINAAERAFDQRVMWIYAATGSIGACFAAAALAVGVHDVISGSATIGTLAVLVSAIAVTQAAALTVVMNVGQLREALLLFADYQDLVESDGLSDAIASADLQLRARVRTDRALPSRNNLQGIRVEDVWFRFTSRHPWVLKGVTLEITPGATVALVGPNGSGKSTLVKLLCQLYQPEHGAIYWDGIDIRQLPLDEFRERLSVVFQDFMTYDLTASENIGLGAVGRLDDRARVESAAKMADVYDDLRALPNGFDTLLSRVFAAGQSDVGVQLSSGQWQRVAIARAFMRDAEFVIFDEPSASLDPMAEHELLMRLATLRHRRTALLISHRLSNVRIADSIVVLENGQVAESGSHEALLTLNGLYARLYRRQESGFRDVDCVQSDRPEELM